MSQGSFKLIDAIADEIAATMREHTAEFHHMVVAKIGEKTRSVTLDVWPCPINPEGKYLRSIESFDDVKITLGYIDIRGSNVAPPVWHDPGQPEYPLPGICSDFTIHERYFPDYAECTPEAWLQKHWPAVCAAPNVVIDACFGVEIVRPTARTSSIMGVDIVARWDDVGRARCFRNLNATLLDEEAPLGMW